MLTEISHQGRLLAIVLRASFSRGGIHFLTPDSFSQQLGYMKRPIGYSIAPHDHNPVPRTIEWTQEVLFIKSGRVRLDIYAPESREYLESRILEAGDVALLAHGGHGLVMLEESEIIEVKQGPYAGEADKTRFTQVDESLVVINDATRVERDPFYSTGNQAHLTRVIKDLRDDKNCAVHELINDK